MLANIKSRDLAPMASNRLVEAFWHLVKNNRTERITVTMVVQEARCSRGSFYYHFEDMGSMVNSVMINELILSGLIPRTIHAILMGEYDELKLPQSDFHVKRVQLLAAQSNLETISNAVNSANTQIWTHLLAADNEKLSNEARFLVDFFSAGMWHSFGMQLFHPGAEGNDPLIESEALRESTIAFVRQTCKAQGTTGNSFIKKLEALRESGWVPNKL